MRSIWNTRTFCASLVTAALVCGGSVSTAGAQTEGWVSNGPEGGSIWTLAIDPQSATTLYAGTLGGGIFKSTDGGASWSAANAGLPVPYPLVRALAIDPRTPTTLYAGGGGVFKSTDGGRSWNAVNSGLPASPAGIVDLAIDPQTPTTLYAASSHGSAAVYKSTDGGASWSASGTGIRFPTVRVLAVDPLTPNTLYAGSFDGAFKSVDGGASWSPLNGIYTGGSDIPALAVDPQTPTTLYAANVDGRTVYKSFDGGVTWTAVNAGLSNVRVSRLAIDPRTPSTLYAGTTGWGVFKSVDGGGSWNAVNTGLNVSPPYVLSLAIDAQNPTTLYAGFQGAGVFKSNDGGGSWAVVNRGLVNAAVSSVALDRQNPAVVYTGTDTGFHGSTDGGNTWGSLDTRLSASAVAVDPLTPTTLYAGGYTSTGSRGVFKSADGGKSWNLIGLSGIAVNALVIDPSSPNILYAGTTSSDGFFKSVDGGTTWRAVNTGLTARNVWALAIDEQTPSTIYAGTGYNYPDICRGVFKSTDGGNSWIELGPRDRAISAVAVDPRAQTTLYASSSQWACGGGGPQDPGVYKSTDGGTSWTAVSPYLTLALAIDPRAPGFIYAGTSNRGVLRSTNGGLTWSEFNSGLTNLSLVDLVVDTVGRRLYAGTAGGGVFARDVMPPTVEITSPAGDALVSGTVAVAANASDNVGVAGVRFFVDGTPIAVEDTAAPYGVAWETTLVSEGSHTLSAVARDAGGNTAVSAGVVVTVVRGTVQASTALAPEDTSLNLDATTYSGATLLMTYTWPDYRVANVIVMKFDLSGIPAGAIVHEATLHLALVQSDAMPESTYTVSAHRIVGRNPVISAATGYTADGATAWTANLCCYNNVPIAQADISPAYDRRAIDKTPGFKSWTVTAMVREWLADPARNFGLLLNSDAAKPRDRYRYFASTEHPDPGLRPSLRVSYSSGDSTPPSVAITSPASDQPVSGTVSVTASASDNVGVAGVQFFVDGVPLEAERTTSPYSVAWDTTRATSGSHTLTAGARDAAGNVNTSAPVTVTVSNPSSTPLTFARGDVLISLETGPVQWWHPNGTLEKVMTGAVGGTGEGMDFDPDGNLYVTRWCTDDRCSNGEAVEKFDASGRLLGTFGGSYDCAPHAIVFDAVGTAYVGQGGCTGAILKFAPGQAPVAFAVAPDIQGSFWVDLAADACTIVYTSWGPNVKRFDTCTRTQLSDFNVAPLPGGAAQDLRVLPDGGVLVSSGQVIARLDRAGALVQTYEVPGESTIWAGLDLVGDGTFWAGNYESSNVYRFDLASGAVLARFNTGTPTNTVVGVTVKK